MELERIGRYRIIEQLGRGGFATVYLCEDRSLDDRVAVKLLAENHSQDPESVSRFVAEARVMRTLRTPGVVTVHDVGEHEGQPYFVMEYCERGTLSARLRSIGRPITVAEGIGLAGAISEAMVGLHGSEPPVVHRDIKPDNLLIRKAAGPRREPVGGLLAADEELIVGDFGLAKVVDLQSTKMSLIAYTRGFAPPEQVRGHAAIQPSADVYSASAVLVSAVSGESPEQVFSPGEPAFSEPALAATGPLRTELERGIQFGAEHRQQTVMDWAQALETAGQGPPSAEARGVTIHVSAPTAVPSPPTDRSVPPLDLTSFPPPATDHPSAGRGKLLLAIGGAVTVFAAAILGVVLYTMSGTSIVGPDAPRVGEEAAYVVAETEVQAWEVGGQRTEEPVLLLSPTSVGRVTLRAFTADGEVTTTVEVADASTGLRIAGPGHLPVGVTTVLSAEGADGSDLTWVVKGTDYQLETLEVRPAELGTLTVELRSSDGRSVTRTFTAADGG